MRQVAGRRRQVRSGVFAACVLVTGLLWTGGRVRAESVGATAVRGHVERLRELMLEARAESVAHAHSVRAAYTPSVPALMLADRAALARAVDAGQLVGLPDPAGFGIALRLEGRSPIGELDLDHQHLYTHARPEVVGMLLDVASRLDAPLDVTSLVRHSAYQLALARANPNARTRLHTHAMGLAADISVLHMPLDRAREVRAVLRAMAGNGDLHFAAERRQLVFHVVPAESRREHYRHLAEAARLAGRAAALYPWRLQVAAEPSSLRRSPAWAHGVAPTESVPGDLIPATWPEPFVTVDGWIGRHRQPVARASAAGLLAVCVWLMAWRRGPRRSGQGDDEPAAA
jgi:hypothetical protein